MISRSTTDKTVTKLIVCENHSYTINVTIYVKQNLEKLNNWIPRFIIDVHTKVIVNNPHQNIYLIIICIKLALMQYIAFYKKKHIL